MTPEKFSSLQSDGGRLTNGAAVFDLRDIVESH